MENIHINTFSEDLKYYLRLFVFELQQKKTKYILKKLVLRKHFRHLRKLLGNFYF